MSDIRIHLNADLEQRVAEMPTVLDSAMTAASGIADAARSDAPVATGAYQSSIVAEKTRKGARVFAADPKSAWIEFGIPGRGIPAHFNLRSAAKRLGFKFRKGRR